MSSASRRFPPGSGKQNDSVYNQGLCCTLPDKNVYFNSGLTLYKEGNIKKRICFVVVLLVLVLLSATAFAQKADKELCLTSKSDNSAVTSQNTHVLSYTGLSNGHVLFYGETCYVIPAANELPESTGCLPGSGSGILSNN